jgi:hypothetical protein
LTLHYGGDWSFVKKVKRQVTSLVDFILLCVEKILLMQYRRTSNCEFAADSALAPVDILPNLTIQRFIQLETASSLATGALTAVPCSIKN